MNKDSTKTSLSHFLAASAMIKRIAPGIASLKNINKIYITGQDICINAPMYVTPLR